MLLRYIFISASCMVSVASDGAAADAPSSWKVVQSCRSIGSDAERLLCFDKALEAMNVRIIAGEIAIVDSRVRHNAQRKVFGLSGLAPQASANERLSSVSSRITGLAPNVDGSWVVTLADGTQWRTAGDLSGKIAVGHDVVVSRDGFSRYKLASQAGRTAIVYRVR